MSSNEVEHPEFQGRDLKECKQFIAAVNKHAHAEGKLWDDQWIADFVAVRLADEALIWWSLLGEETQRSWRLLRQAMISRFLPRFYGRSGTEAEDFVSQIRERALNMGTHNDPHWMADFASTCFAGRALRWYASLDPSVRGNWESLQQAIFTQYSEDSAAPIVPTQNATRHRYRGRIRVCKNGDSRLYYLSKFPRTDSKFIGRIMLTSAIGEALQVEYEPASASNGLQTLTIPDGQIQGCDLLGMKWVHADTNRADNPVDICSLSSSSGNESICTHCVGPHLTTAWEISASANEQGTRSIFGMRGPGRRLLTLARAGDWWIWLRQTEQSDAAEAGMFFEPV